MAHKGKELALTVEGEAGAARFVVCYGAERLALGPVTADPDLVSRGWAFVDFIAEGDDMTDVEPHVYSVSPSGRWWWSFGEVTSAKHYGRESTALWAWRRMLGIIWASEASQTATEPR